MLCFVFLLVMKFLLVIFLWLVNCFRKKCCCFCTELMANKFVRLKFDWLIDWLIDWWNSDQCGCRAVVTRVVFCVHFSNLWRVSASVLWHGTIWSQSGRNVESGCRGRSQTSHSKPVARSCGSLTLNLSNFYYMITLSQVHAQSIAIRMSVCLSIHSHVSETTCPVFTKCSVLVNCGRAVVLLLTTVQFLTYFQYYGWRHVFT